MTKSQSATTEHTEGEQNRQVCVPRHEGVVLKGRGWITVGQLCVALPEVSARGPTYQVHPQQRNPHNQIGKALNKHEIEEGKNQRGGGGSTDSK